MIDANQTFGGTWPFAPRYFEGNGFPMHYVDEGAGAPVICLHGNPTWGYLYRKFIPPLSQNHRVVVPDHMGFGKSATPRDRDYSGRAHVENLAGLIEFLDLQDITFVVQDYLSRFRPPSTTSPAYGVIVGSELVIPPIIVSANDDCWFYRCVADALEAGIPAAADVFEGTGRRLEVSDGDLTLVSPGGDPDDLIEILKRWLMANDAVRWSIADWPLSMLLRCSIEHHGWSDRA